MDQAITIKEARQRQKLSQDILAQRAEVSPRTVMRAEGGKAISFENLRSICSVLNLDATSLAPPSSTEPEAAGAPLGPQPAVPMEAGKGTAVPLVARLAGGSTQVEVSYRLFLAHLPVSAAIAGVMLMALAVGNAFFIDAFVTPSRTVLLSKETEAVRGISIYANGVAGGLEGKGLKGFVRTTCAPRYPWLGWALGSLDLACRDEEVRVEKVAMPGGIDQLAAGPISADSGDHVLRRLTRDPGIRWLAAWGRTPHSQGLAWFDPKTTASAEFPQPTDGRSSWLFLRAIRTEGLVR